MLPKLHPTSIEVYYIVSVKLRQAVITWWVIRAVGAKGVSLLFVASGEWRVASGEYYYTYLDSVRLAGKRWPFANPANRLYRGNTRTKNTPGKQTIYINPGNIWLLAAWSCTIRYLRIELTVPPVTYTNFKSYSYKNELQQYISVSSYIYTGYTGIQTKLETSPPPLRTKKKVTNK